MLSEEEIRHVARLARLALTPDDLATLTNRGTVTGTSGLTSLQYVNLTLDGTLNVTLIAPFSPASKDQFDVMSWPFSS